MEAEGQGLRPEGLIARRRSFLHLKREGYLRRALEERSHSVCSLPQPMTRNQGALGF
jgi:hypothetical protein